MGGQAKMAFLTLKYTFWNSKSWGSAWGRDDYKLEVQTPTPNPEIPKQHCFTRELLPACLRYEPGIQQTLFRKARSDELCYFGWIVLGGFFPL